MLLFIYVDMCACSFIHGGQKNASDLLTFPSVRTVNNTERFRIL